MRGNGAVRRRTEAHKVFAWMGPNANVLGIYCTDGTQARRYADEGFQMASQAIHLSAVD